MIDSFVLLAPIYLLGVIALLGFVGCGFEIGHLTPDGPMLRCTASDQAVDLDWDEFTDATQYQVYRMDDPQNPTPLGDPVSPPALTFQDPGLTNGQHYLYAVKAYVVPAEDDPFWTSYSNTVDALPLGSFVKIVDTSLAGFGGRTGFCGMRILIAGSDLKIYTLGRSVVSLTGAHAMKVVDAASKEEMGTASVDPNSQLVGDFRYGKLVPTGPSIEPVTLTAGREYYVLTMEMFGSDQFYDRNTIVTTRLEATVLSAVYSDTATPGVYTAVAGPGNTIGPVSFQY